MSLAAVSKYWMRDFRKYEVWKESMTLVEQIYLLTKKLPSEEKYGLISQLQRAAVSIPSNIAEGCSRSSQKEFMRFIEIALGSSYELETQLELVNRLDYLPDTHIVQILPRLELVQSKLGALRNRLK